MFSAIDYVRMVGGRTDGEGRVEVLRDNKYGLICQDNWDINDATVVCNDLGYRY